MLLGLDCRGGVFAWFLWGAKNAKKEESESLREQKVKCWWVR